ncbi:MAG: UDP-N-acetylglucosamine--N-acetylmuramyl-(pentapeptide) pyrophosphoryl-undecaprenol N-acetylglucosamine transferase [Actinomycetota bacterium]|nr:UDP-N-acetylglucosamine--N-acetylmuramyl-(pentapeptide) pyrophosphoryl-undecaprenol N-acetylglucosamine transferase [Actinomycetota bacterium]MDK1096091.1 UDP-N-acetylglucosamine--N-acetylmuramyl-(pentapeptide) pyrophosphoryl-undecaprenol N-acetylglucosamine transferase [Actinomycetota bacterium]MDK1291029.1 UDP-N-acetylglucosamine--N-acetylmuramyl-(pentapeptide) pyrophosphoryl-undecaprenol N-acetylglucosamine transferase [Actinomycetota bacterium]
MKIGIAAAGSGGHVYPGLAVGDALVDLGIEQGDIIFFGGDRMEMRSVPAAGYRFVQVDMHGFRRSLSTDNLTLPLKVYKATRVIADEIRAEGIRAMVVFGGYISGPAGLAARRTKIPLIIHEANAVPGVANRMLAPFTHSIYVAFEPARARLKRAEVVGNPLRSAFEHFDRDLLKPVARVRYGIDPDATVLGVFGGSLGAAALNDIAAEIATGHGRQYHVLQITGEPHFQDFSARATETDRWTVVAFESEMEYLYAASDLVLSRSGAMTVSELQATATPAILVPLPAGRRYQGANADDLAAGGGVIVINQDSRHDIVATTRSLLHDAVRRKTMTDALAEARPSGVARTIAKHVLEVADDRPS